jgi:hypothetical protein
VDCFALRILEKTSLEFYVVYEDCDQAVLKNDALNTDPDAGDSHLTTKFQPLEATLVNRCAVYAYDASPSASLKRKADGPPSSE